MNLLHETLRGSPLEPAGSLVRRVRLAGVLLFTGSLCAVPATLALDPLPPAPEYLIPLAGVLVALAFLLTPGARVSPAWIHAGIVVATALVAAAVAAMSNVYALYYVVIAIYAAYALEDARAHLGYGALLIAALFVPLTYTETAAHELHHILVILPVLTISSLIVIDLRRAIADRERTYRGFAAEATALTSRIRRSSARPPNDERTHRAG